MTQCETETGEVHLGEMAFHEGLPGAIRTLQNEELCALLVALLREWRGRTVAREQHDRIIMPTSPA